MPIPSVFAAISPIGSVSFFCFVVIHSIYSKENSSLQRGGKSLRRSPTKSVVSGIDRSSGYDVLATSSSIGLSDFIEIRKVTAVKKDLSEA